ncbi:MAG: glycosyltransferase [Clostridia bacterium]|nr:glycosyltransferase [Clostridia bacterium]
MRKIIFYQSNFSQIGGVETMAYNWCWWLRNYFDVTVLYCTGDAERIRKMSRLVKMEKYEEGKTYECDIFIRNSVWGLIPKNIKAKRMIEMRHANYKYLLDKGLLYQQYKDMGIKEIVGCGEFVSKMSHEALGDNPTTIKNILLPRKETNKIIRLISCTRLDPAKGWNRMLKMIDMMRNAGIKFTWDIFTNSTMYKCNYEEVHFYKQRYDIWDYLANADYTVLLSDSEGLPYTIQESLQYQVPCIVTDVGGCTELIKDGVNGYVVPLDMNFDINKIKKIPKCPEYKNGALEKWLNYLGYDGKIIDEKVLIQKFEKEENMKVRVKAMINFNDLEENKHRAVGEVFECSKARCDYLLEHKAIEIVEEIKEETPKVKVEVNIDSKKVAEKIIEVQDKPESTKKKKSSKK